MKALRIDRKLARFAAARVAGSLRPGSGAAVGPLELADIDPPELPAAGWVRLRPRLAGICGSDLSTVDGAASRYFEPIVSFPFVPGHEVVADTDDDRRVVLEPVLGCVARGISPVCVACARGDLGGCERLAFGSVEPGLQTGLLLQHRRRLGHVHGGPREPAPPCPRGHDRRGRRDGRAHGVRGPRRAHGWCDRR